MKEPTVKQMALIKEMEQLLDVQFKGNTIKEASEFISMHMKDYRDKLEFVFEMTYNENNY